MRLRRILLTIAMIALMLLAAFADVPGLMSYQGILKDSQGQPVEDDVYAIKFTIYNAETEGVVLWESNGFIPIQTADGLFAHILGSTNPLPDSLSRHSDLWVGITVNLDEELSPRTRLVSVPFSLNAQYSDTAGTSLDKTVDASELTEGTLDVERFSAYEDLVAENKIGNGVDHVAAGSHIHFGNQNTISRMEDTTLIEFNPTEQYTMVKSVNFQQGQAGDFFRIGFPMFSNSSLEYYISINGQSIFLYWLTNSCGNSYCDQPIMTMTKLSATEWILAATVNWDDHLTSVVSFNVNQELLFELFVRRIGSSFTTAKIGNFIVEYDVD